MFVSHLRYALRNLRRAPGFTAAAICSLALGIGGNVAMFSLINAAMIKPLAYPDADALVVIRTVIPKLSQLGPSLPVKAGVVLQWRDALRSFDAIGAATGRSVTVGGDGDPARVGAVMMTAEFLNVLGATPQSGRWFVRAEETMGARDVVVVSNSLWRHRFSADPGVLGRQILIDGKPYEVVGIAPATMPFPHGQLEPRLPERAELFLPLRLSKYDLDLTSNIVEAECVTIGRLKRGVSVDTARSELEVSMAALSRINRRRLEMHAAVSPLRDALVRDSRKGLLVLSAAVGFVLLIVCINIANLTLVRATAKRQELAIRTALGATTRDLLQATVAESVLVAVCGTAAGLLLAWWLIDLVITTAPADLVSIQNVAVDANVFLFTSMLGALTALLFGLLPAWRVCRTARVDLVHVNGRGITSGPQLGFLRSALVGAELAFGTVLLIGAGLLLTSFHRVMGVSRGFDVDNIIAVDLSLPEAKYRTEEEKLSFFARVQERVQAIPGIGPVAYANGVPLTPPEGQSYVIRENKNTVAWEDLPLMTWWHTGGGYFSAMGIPLISGRTFSDQERELVAIVSEAAARRLWPGENPIGQKVRHPIDPDKTRWFQVIAVVGNVRDKALDHDPSPALYIPYWQGSCCRLHTEALTLVARTATDAKTIGRTIREQVWSVDREVAVPEVRTMERILSASVEKRRFHVAMLALFAAIALLLAVTGVFGVTTYAVAQRRRDIGIRIALGAKPRDVLAHVVGQGMKPIASGLAMGVIGAAALTRYLASLLFEVHALDPLTFAIIPLFLGATALLACYVPARQAAAIDPMKVLREQ